VVARPVELLFLPAATKSCRPVREKISGDKGCYTKFNTVVKQRMKVKEFREIATSKAYEAPSFGGGSLADIDR